MLDSVIIPLVKNKCGDLSDTSNYRPIAISCIVSKILENVILQRIEEYLWTTDNQFGFKAHHSTDLCVYNARIRRVRIAVCDAFYRVANQFSKWFAVCESFYEGMDCIIIHLLLIPVTQNKPVCN